jgi:hypothetical protein
MSLPPALRSKDQENIRLLSIFHYVVGGLYALLSCIALIYVVLGIVFLVTAGQARPTHGEQTPPAALGWIFIAFGTIGFLIGEAFAICVIMAGRKLASLTNHTFVFVTACIECLMMPFGTVLGIFTIITLSKPEVKQLFAGSPQPVPAPDSPIAPPPIS